MGIKGLGALVKPYGKAITLSEIQNSKIVIDTPIYLYKFKYQASTSQFLYRFQDQIDKFKENGITPIYLFDGVHPQQKKGTQESRKQTQTIFISREEIVMLKKLFDDSGVEYLTAPTEAEKLCSYYNKTGKADYVLSNDYDTFVFDCKKLITCCKETLTLYQPSEIILDLGINRENFVEACIASGCDFYPMGIPGIGLKSAIKLIKAGISINLWRKEVSPDFLELLPDIKSIFLDFCEEEKC